MLRVFSLITKPAAQLGVVLYTFIITGLLLVLGSVAHSSPCCVAVIIYAQFGLVYFEDTFVYDPDYEDDKEDVSIELLLVTLTLTVLVRVPFRGLVLLAHPLQGCPCGIYGIGESLMTLRGRLSVCLHDRCKM